MTSLFLRLVNPKIGLLNSKLSYNSSKANYDTLFMYKASALKSSIQLMRIERNHAPHGNHYENTLWQLHHDSSVCCCRFDSTMHAGLSQDTSDLLCPPGFVSGVLNIVMTQRWASCHQMIQTGELLRGRKYQIVMRWRPDIRPLTQFPSLLDPVWTSFFPREIIVPGYLRYFGSTTAQVCDHVAFAADDITDYVLRKCFGLQDQWAIMHRSDSYSALVGASETMWQCSNKSELRRLCLGSYFDYEPGSPDVTLNLRQCVESSECIWTGHLYQSGLQPVLASAVFGRNILWQYDTAHPGVYGRT